MKNTLFVALLCATVCLSTAGSYESCDCGKGEDMCPLSLSQKIYFEPSIVPPEVVGVTIEDEVAGRGVCGEIYPGTNHRLVCGEDAVYGGGFALEPADGSCPTSTVMYLHGIAVPGSTGNILDNFAALLQLIGGPGQALEHARIAHPLADFRNLTEKTIPLPPSETGTRRSYFDLLEYTTDTSLEAILGLSWDRLGLYRATEQLAKVIENEEYMFGVPTDQVVLYGHSFGGSLALDFALSNNAPLAGVVSVAGFVPRPADYFLAGARAINPAPRSYPITLFHGTDDLLIPVEYGLEFSGQILENVLAPITGNVIEKEPIAGVGHISIFASPQFNNALALSIERMLS